MKALIDGSRVCQVAENEFPVAPPLFWVDAPDGIVPDSHTYVDGQFVEPAPVVIETPPEPTKAQLMAQVQALMAKVEAL